MNTSGELGNGTSGGSPVTAPPTTPIAGSWRHVAAISGTTCAIRADRTLWCWGADQPTDASGMDTAPTQVGTAADWDSIALAQDALGGLELCGVKTGGTLWCWGSVNDASGPQTLATPIQVGSDTRWQSIALGVERCGVKTDGTLWCWDNDDVLGDGRPVALDPPGNSIRALAPTQLGTATDWRTVSTGGPSCATKTDGSVRCWGYGASPTPDLKTAPVAVK